MMTTILKIIIWALLGFLAFQIGGTPVLLVYIALLVGWHFFWDYWIHEYTDPIPEAPAGKIRVACVGDSITYGAMVRDRPNNCYPKQLENMLGDKYAVRNFGVNGRTMCKNGDRPYWKHKNFKRSMEFNPDLVLIMLGTNDSKLVNKKASESFENDCIALVNGYKELPSKPKVILLTPATAHLVNGKKVLNYGMDNTPMDRFGEIIYKIASSHDLGFVDIRSFTKSHPEYFPFDGIHTDENGAADIAKEVYKAVWGDQSAINP